MRFSLTLLLFFCAIHCHGQITPAQQKALNAYVDYANQSADEVALVVKSLYEYYPAIHRKKSWGPPRYVCPVQMEEYYFKTATEQSKNLGPALSGTFSVKLKELRGVAEKIDEKCKALDTYHKLEDYKQDNFQKAEALINELQALLPDYQKKQHALSAALEEAYRKLNPNKTGNYAKADAAMRQQINSERNFLDQWNYNLKAEVHTGWPVGKLEQSILDSDRQLQGLKKLNPTLKYPASSMWPSFQEALQTVVDIKRRGLDEYNFEAKKSDEHSNGVYMELINYFNGALVSDYNTFLQFSERDGYYGLKTVKYFPLFEVRTQPDVVAVTVTPFKDLPRTPVTISKQTAPVSKGTFEALSEYVAYIDETWRQARSMQSTMNSFNSSAAYYKNMDDYSRHGAMHFEFKDYQVPLSYYQKAIAAGEVLPPNISKSLNDQAEVLLNILKEMSDQAAVLEVEVKEKRYEKDRLEKVYSIIERQHELLLIWDERKELFYSDVRKVFDAHPPATPSSSWYISGKALRTLTDLDHDEVFKAKDYYAGKTGVVISTEKIDATVRDILAKEYNNMKGIEKYGRYNGLCPYTPYEDLPATSRTLSERLVELKPAKGSLYEHPYHSMVYLYNEVVDDYNKFCELSASVYHLKTIHQPELWVVKYPEDKKPEAQKVVPAVATATGTTAVVTQANPGAVIQQPAKQEPVVVVKQTDKVVHDTVFIEKRDTVYLGDPNEDLRSMEGYATNNLILLLDVSGSMNTPEKLPVLKKSVLDMLTMMRQEDHVSIVSFSGKPKTLLESVSFKEEEKIRKAIDNLKSSGKTDGNAGLKLAYKVADGNYIRGGNNRIILATDGEFVLNEEILQLIEKFSKDDIFLTVFNFGKGAGTSRNLEKLASLGKGNYAYISKENVDVKLIHEAKAKKKK
jgi:Ca-activated chloride channel homolog